MYKHKITVFTPTYNRKHTLSRCYRSLLDQKFKDFEWLIVDDGSTDGTEELLKDFSGAGFPIRYFRQKHGGKHVAANKGAEMAEGELFYGLDSDDMLLPDGLEILYESYCSIPDQAKPEFGIVLGLISGPDGNVIGKKFPRDIIDGNYIDIGFKYGIGGDKAFFTRTDVLKRFPFPVFDGETFLAESIVWNKIVLGYKTRCVNRVVAKVEYRKDGLSKSSARNRMLNPIGAFNNYREILNMPAKKPLGFMAKNSVNYCRFILHARQTKNLFSGLNKKNWFLAIVCFPIGTAYYAADKIIFRNRRS